MQKLVNFTIAYPFFSKAEAPQNANEKGFGKIPGDITNGLEWKLGIIGPEYEGKDGYEWMFLGCIKYANQFHRWQFWHVRRKYPKQLPAKWRKIFYQFLPESGRRYKLVSYGLFIGRGGGKNIE